MMTSAMERTALRLRAAKLYVEGNSTKEVAHMMGVSSATVRRYLQYAGVPMRKSWDRGKGIRSDGRKQCRKCDEWKASNDFYSRKSGGLYSYCKPCDRDRAVKDQKNNRQLKRSQSQVVRDERRRHNKRSRSLLLDALQLIDYHFPDVDVAYDIKAHLENGKKLFGDKFDVPD
jgi:predicted DNA-binding protein (UPF0251 family)